MIKKKILPLLLAALLVPGTLLSACGNKSEGEVKSDNTSKVEEKKEKQVKDTIIYALWSSPTGVFNPLLADTLYDNTVISTMYASLLELDGDLNLTSGLAESYEVSDDNLSITFTMKKDLKWHDGEKLTAKDVVFTLKSIAHKDYEGALYGDVEKIKGAQAYHEGKAEDIEGIKVVDDNTIKVEFEEVYAPSLLSIGTMSIIPEHIWSKEPVGNWKENKELLNNPVGSGPYKFTSFEPGQYVKLKRFDDYYGGKAKTENFIFKVTNQETAQAELVNGTIDIADISSSKKKDIDTLKDEKLKITTYSNPNFQYLGFNLRNDELQDKNLRKAFAYAIDRKLILDKLLEGNGVLLNTPMVPTGWAYPGEDVLEQYAYNLDKAKELLKEAGWEDRDNDGIVENEQNEDLKLVLKYPLGDKTREQCAPIIQDSLKKIGVDIELQNMEFSTLMEQVVGNHEFDLFLMMNTLGLDPDPKPYWHSTASTDEKGVYGWNMSALRNKEADKLMEQGLETLDMKERKEVYKKFGKLMNDELPWISLYSQNVVKAYNPNLKNYEPTTYLNFNDIEDWYIEE